MKEIRAFGGVSLLLSLILCSAASVAAAATPDRLGPVAAGPLIVPATFVLAGIVKGVTGLGLPTVSMAVLGSLMPPVAAAALLVVPSFVTNVWQVVAGPAWAALARRLWLLFAGEVVGTLCSANVLNHGRSEWTAVGLGLSLIVYGGLALSNVRFVVSARWERTLSPLVGLATGLVTGATGVFVVPAVPYLQSLGLEKDELIQALGLSFTVSSVALALGLSGGGALQVQDVGASALAVLPALFGMWLGQLIRARVSPQAFRLWFLICLVLLGGHLVVHALV